MKTQPFSIRQFFKQYGIYLAPILCIGFLVAESYQVDFRPLYVAGRSVILDFNPYFNPVGEYPELFAAGNAGYRPTSGFRYPPLAAMLLTPLGMIPSYEVARVIFSLLMLAALVGVVYLVARERRFQLSGAAIVLGLVSFPTLALFERGQIEILLALMGLAAFYLYQQPQRRWLASLLLALAAHLKVFPALLVLYFWVAKRDWRFGLQSLAWAGALVLGSYLYLGDEVYLSFFQRSLPQFFGHIPYQLPDIVQDQGVEYWYIVRAIQGNNKIFTHDFANGKMNPLLFEHPVLAILLGCLGFVGVLWLTRRRPEAGRFFAAINLINLANPMSWVMAIVWYLPLFLYLFDRVGTKAKALLLLPLFLPPPHINSNGYAALAVVLAYALGKLDFKAAEEQGESTISLAQQS